MRLAPLLFVLAAGCRAAPPAPPAASGDPLASASASAEPADSAPLASASAPTPASLPPHADGCWGLALPEDGTARLSALGQRCAPGFSPLFEKPRETARGEWVALPALKEGSCVRVAAAGSGAIELAGPGGLLAQDLGGDFALSPAVCPRKGEALRLRVAAGGPGAPSAALVQAWATPGR